MKHKSRFMHGDICPKSSDSSVLSIWDGPVACRNRFGPMTDQRSRGRVTSVLAMTMALIFSTGCGGGSATQPPQPPVTAPSPPITTSATEQCNEPGNILPAGNVNTDLQISGGTACVVDGSVANGTYQYRNVNIWGG